MGDPMKIRAKMVGDVAEVRVLMGHAMETGQRKGSDGKIIPAHFIKEIRAELNGKVVFEAAISQAISRWFPGFWFPPGRRPRPEFARPCPTGR